MNRTIDYRSMPHVRVNIYRATAQIAVCRTPGAKIERLFQLFASASRRPQLNAAAI
jgi:hypothetical protein